MTSLGEHGSDRITQTRSSSCEFSIKSIAKSLTVEHYPELESSQTDARGCTMLSRSRHAARRPSPTVDVFLSGLLFFDLVFTGLDQPPTPGTEVWTGGMGSGPGGIANFAVALRRLGLRTVAGRRVRRRLLRRATAGALLADAEGVDLSRSRRFPGWATPVTVALAYDGDRALVTHGEPPPLSAGRADRRTAAQPRRGRPHRTGAGGVARHARRPRAAWSSPTSAGTRRSEWAPRAARAARAAATPSCPTRTRR